MELLEHEKNSSRSMEQKNGKREIRMQIVIDIPDGLYARLENIENGSMSSKRILDCVRNGIPLPKGHGRIGDLDYILVWLIIKGIIDKDDFHFSGEIT